VIWVKQLAESLFACVADASSASICMFLKPHYEITGQPEPQAGLCLHQGCLIKAGSQAQVYSPGKKCSTPLTTPNNNQHEPSKREGRWPAKMKCEVCLW